jgi:hypothetical protein
VETHRKKKEKKKAVTPRPSIHRAQYALIQTTSQTHSLAFLPLPQDGAGTQTGQVGKGPKFTLPQCKRRHSLGLSYQGKTGLVNYFAIHGRNPSIESGR